jgi:hypothetical protein
MTIERPVIPKPSVGRVVHYVPAGWPKGEHEAGICRAATITEVIAEGDLGPVVSLCVMHPNGSLFERGVALHAGVDHLGVLRYPGCTWHWPERVE